MNWQQLVVAALVVFFAGSFVVTVVSAFLHWLPRSRGEAWDKLTRLAADVGGIALVLAVGFVLAAGFATDVGKIILGIISGLLFLVVVVMIAGTLVFGNRYPER